MLWYMSYTSDGMVVKIFIIIKESSDYTLYGWYWWNGNGTIIS